MILVKNISLTPAEADNLEFVLYRKLQKIVGGSNFSWEIHLESIDARSRRNKSGGRNKSGVSLIYQCALSLDDPKQERYLLKRPNIESVLPHTYPLLKYSDKIPDSAKKKVLIVGLGPAGLFAAYNLARQGFKPIVIEQGEAVEDRAKRVTAFWSGRESLNPYSNVQFGEGGAGTFSDGKLTSRSKDFRKTEVLSILAKYADDKSILYAAKAHIGTDRLRKVISKMRQDIVAWGGEVYFNTRFIGLSYGNDQSITVYSQKAEFKVDYCVLALGHSSRETYKYLIKQKMAMEQKDFAVGLRIEHRQDWLEKQQYGDFAYHQALPRASYQLNVKVDNGTSSAYTFCMCPGGLVINASSEPGRLAVNGMSYQSRAKENANSAVLVAVKAGKDYGVNLTDGINFQEDLERRAFLLAGAEHTAPIQDLGSFLEPEKKVKVSTSLRASFLPKTRESRLDSLFSDPLAYKLKEGIRAMDKKLNGFAQEEAILTGVESRSSAPLRILRDSWSLESLSHPKVFPCGEGAGYAGGIVSSAIDGLKVSERIIEKCGLAKDV